MSRSYRKTLIIKENGRHKQFWKRQANKRVRHSDVGSGGEFKKHYDTWNICDWKYRIKEVTKKILSK